MYLCLYKYICVSLEVIITTCDCLFQSIWGILRYDNSYKHIQAYLGDIAGSVPNFCSKVHAVINLHTFFLFFSAYKSHVYAIL